jgi:hypothetical protein
LPPVPFEPCVLCYLCLIFLPMEKPVLPELLFTFLSLNLYIVVLCWFFRISYVLNADTKLNILVLSDKYLILFFYFFRFIILTL